MRKIGIICIGALVFLCTLPLQAQTSIQEVTDIKAKEATKEQMTALSKVVSLQKEQKRSIEQLYLEHEKSIFAIIQNPQGEGLQNKIVAMETALDQKILALLTPQQKEELKRHRGKTTTLDKH
ncbi:hypothetical protein [Spongiimicrobium salis]|uniref:hypothetical protein n=1 Tax=Spongiimicrobium salis TaxID=1667022 RepID=UPI00374D50CB